MAKYKFKVRNGIHFDIPSGSVWHEGQIVEADYDMRKKYANKFDLVDNLSARSSDEDDDGDGLQRSRRKQLAKRGNDPLEFEEEDVDPEYDPLRDERISTNKAIRESLMEKRRMALLRSKVDDTPERRNQRAAAEGEFAVSREGHPAQRLAKIRADRQAQRDEVEARTLRDADEDRPRSVKKGLKKGLKSKGSKSSKNRAARNAELLSVTKKTKKKSHATAE